MAFFVAKGSEAAAAEEEKGSDLLAAAALTEALAREGQLWSLGRPRRFLAKKLKVTEATLNIKTIHIF